MPQFQRRFTVNAPVQDVACFHRRTQALKQLTPPPVFVQLHQVQPLSDGARADFTLWLGPLPVRWSALHEVEDLSQGFIDHQVSGPFASWVHRHAWRALDARTTEVLDHISAEFSRHWFWKLVGWLMWLNLPLMFAYRAWVTRRLSPDCAAQVDANVSA